jgi:DNA-binding XRE family transcriptional regulator
MFKTEEQINSRLNSSKNLVNRFVKSEEKGPIVETIILERPGNKEKPKLDEEQKTEIAIRSRSGETQVSLAKEFNVSQSAIGEIEQGRTKVNEKTVEARLNVIEDRALDKLLETLGFITPDKMDKAKAGEISSVASNLSKVVSNIRGKDKNDNGINVSVQVFAPEIRPERLFKTIEVNS